MNDYVAPRTSEKAIQRDVCALLRRLGAAVYTIGTVRRRGDHPGTMQTPGLPDVLCFLPIRDGRRTLLLLELKAQGGRLSTHQKAFRAYCEQAQLGYVTGNLDTVIAWLEEAGYLKGAASWRTESTCEIL